MKSATIKAVGRALQEITASQPDPQLADIASKRITKTWDQLHQEVNSLLEAEFSFEDANQFRSFIQDHRSNITANQLVVIHETPMFVTVYGLNPTIGEGERDPPRNAECLDSYLAGYQQALDECYVSQYKKGYKTAMRELKEAVVVAAKEMVSAAPASDGVDY